MSDRACRNCLRPLLPTDTHCPHCGDLVREEGPPLGRVVGQVTVTIIVLGIGIPIAMLAGALGSCLGTGIGETGAGTGSMVVGIIFGVVGFSVILWAMIVLLRKLWKD